MSLFVHVDLNYGPNGDTNDPWIGEYSGFGVIATPSQHVTQYRHLVVTYTNSSYTLIISSLFL